MKASLKLTAITRDPRLAVRKHLDPKTVQRYVDSNHNTPPVHVFKIGEEMLLAAGYHRYEAALARGDVSIEAIVHRGSIEEAEAFALVDNAKHGLPLTAEERDEAISRLTDLKWSQRRIAEELSIAATTVQRALKAQEVMQLCHAKGLPAPKPAIAREIAEAPKTRWEEIGRAAGKHHWGAKETGLAIENLGDRRLSDAQKAKVLGSGVPLDYDPKTGEPIILKTTIDRKLGEDNEHTAAIQFGKIQSLIHSVCEHWKPSYIVDGVIKFGQKDFDALLKDLPEEIALLQAILDEAQSRGKLKLVAG